jgi:hypothetical protein
VQKRYLPFGDKNKGAPIITLINVDRLNSSSILNQMVAFDYIEKF